MLANLVPFRDYCRVPEVVANIWSALYHRRRGGEVTRSQHLDRIHLKAVHALRRIISY